MPGIIVFRRRWAVGSDDLVVPALILVVFHSAWLLGLSVSLVTIPDGEPPPAVSTTNGTIVGGAESDFVSAAKNYSAANNGTNADLLLSDDDDTCRSDFVRYVLLFVVVWSVALLTEVTIAAVALKGTIFVDEERRAQEYLLYVKLVLWILEIALSCVCVEWLSKNYPAPPPLPLTLISQEPAPSPKPTEEDDDPCPALSTAHKNVIMALVISNAVVFLTALVTMWCAWDVAGRSWVKLKKYQKSLRDQQSSGVTGRAAKMGGKKAKLQYKRSGSNPTRSWRHRKVRRAYQSSWNHRCQMLFCCVKTSKGKSQSSFGDIARVLSEFFRDLDVVPTDIVVGLVLLRQRQQMIRMRVVNMPNNNVYQFLSGIRVTPDTKFLSAQNPDDVFVIREAHHYMHFAIGVYGWPMYFRKDTSALAVCRLCASLRCSCCPCARLSKRDDPRLMEILNDNCCGCNAAAYSHLCDLPNVTLVYITYHVDVGETPFLVAVDYEWRTVVVSIRGTLSLKDVITDLNAECDPLPIRPVKEDWMGHKGMIDAAAYVHRKLREENLLERAFNLSKETQGFGLVCVGHSLGAGAAAILAIMLRQEYPSTRGWAYSPPGGTLSYSAMLHSKEFVTSVIVGKDIVPRIGLHQLEALRHDLIQALHKSKVPKWQTLSASLTCCGGGHGGQNGGEADSWTDEDLIMSLASWDSNAAPTADGIDANGGEGAGPNSSMRRHFKTMRSISSSQGKNDKGENGGGRASTEDELINMHPWDSSINMSVHQPLFPPGNTIHLVRKYPKPAKKTDGAGPANVQPEFKGMLADNRIYDEVLISKRMIQDHMPDMVLQALEQYLTLMDHTEPRAGEEEQEGAAATGTSGAAQTSPAADDVEAQPDRKKNGDGEHRVSFGALDERSNGTRKEKTPPASSTGEVIVTQTVIYNAGEATELIETGAKPKKKTSRDRGPVLHSDL